MGTEIQVKSNLLGHYSRRDLNDNSNIRSWPPYPRDKMLPNGHYYNGYLPRAAAEVYPALGKDIMRQRILEHEAIFRKQVLELHRLYTKQKELMSELRREEMLKGRMPVETSLASSPLASQITSEDVAKWHGSRFPLVNSSYNLRPIAAVPEGIQSPANSSKVNSMQATDVQCPNSLGVKSLDILESTRPSKVRRKMFDLQLPADQYIDDGNELEQVKDNKFPEILATPPKEDARADHCNGVILTGDGWRTDKEGQISGSRLYFGVRSIADLNEPLEIDDEESGSANVKPHSNSVARSSNLGSSNDISSSHFVIDANNERGWSSIVEAGEGKGKKSVSQGDHMQNSLLSEVATELSQLGRSQERCIHDIDIPESDNCRESVRSSHLSSRNLFSSPPDPAKSWSKSVMNLKRPGSCSFNQKTPPQNGPPLETTSSSYVKVLQLGGNQGGSGDNLQFQSEPCRNGFHPGSSSSVPREPPCQLHFTPYDHYAYRSEDVALKELVRGRNDAKHHQLSCLEVKTATRLVDLNATLVNFPSGGPVQVKKTEGSPKIPPWLRSETSFSNEAVVRHVDLNAAPVGCLTNSTADKEKKTGDRPKIPPWSKPEMGFQDEDSVRAGSTCRELRKYEAGRGPEGNKMLSWSIASASCSDDEEMSQNSGGRFPSDKRILRFRISEKGTVSDNDRKTRLLDINLPCDSVFELSKLSSAGSFDGDKGNYLKVGHHIDLNLVVGEDEGYVMPSVSNKTGKRIPEIDLEAPAVPDEESGEENGEKSWQLIDEGMTSAAEAMVAISSSAGRNGFSLDEIRLLAGCMEDPLNWFADVTVSCLNDMETRHAAVEEIDDFESMTLKLTEMKLEDYLPKPFVPDIPKEDELAANPTSTRPRRGHARRGRQRRDFQRDILPGLASLSRHEVTEDLQMFGGLMKATGHEWQSGLTRRNARNGSARGRRRMSATSQTTRTHATSPVVQQPSIVDAGIEDRSLTSWGKTTRRPRRQRCPAGNPVAITVMQS